VVSPNYYNPIGKSMQYPDSAREAFDKVFRDKVISVLNKVVETDAEGGVVKKAGTVASTFKGNVRFTSLGELQTELGLTESIDIAITCDTSVSVAVDDLLEYKDVVYVADNVLPSDSHLTIVGHKWLK